MNSYFTQDIPIVFIVIFFSLVITSLSARKLGVGFLFNFLVNIYVISCTFYKFSLEEYSRSDSSFYYESGLSGVNFNFGTEFISYCSGALSNKLNLGFMPIYFIFSIFCIFAIQIFYRTFLDLNGSKYPYILRMMILGVIVIPVGFWGAGLNKEGYALLGVSLFSASLKNDNINKTKILASIVLLVLSRPHIGIVAMFSIVIGSLLSRNAKKSDRFIIFTTSMVSIAFLIPVVLTYIGIDDLSSSYISGYTDVRAEIYSDTSGYINIIDLSPPLRISSYLIRPFPWESSSILQLSASLINILTIIIIIYMREAFVNYNFSTFTFSQLSHFSFIVVGLIILGMTTSNLGISNRQKWMVVIPMLMLLLDRLVNNKIQFSHLKKT